jgi:hypothetical protein
MNEKDRAFHAYEIYDQTHMELVPAPVARDWMDATPERFAYRCLPLAIANQAGWIVLNPVTFSACWDGGPGLEAVAITFASGQADARVLSHFGSGTFTIGIPFLFRTPPGINLWVKGPSNWFKDGAQPLEGVVETDWLPSTFTMNWKLTRPHHPVRFEQGEPICMLVPVSRGLAEGLRPERRRLAENRELAAQYNKWQRERSQFLDGLRQRAPDAVARGWQRDYMKGILPDGTRAEEHQTRAPVQDFVCRKDPAGTGRRAPRPGRHEKGEGPAV